MRRHVGLPVGTRTLVSVRTRGTRVMPPADNHTPLHALVPTLVNRLPAILAEVAALLAEQQPDYAGSSPGTSRRSSAPPRDSSPGWCGGRLGWNGTDQE